jgi:hypothetical protein
MIEERRQYINRLATAIREGNKALSDSATEEERIEARISLLDQECFQLSGGFALTDPTATSCALNSVQADASHDSAMHTSDKRAGRTGYTKVATAKRRTSAAKK